MSDEQPRLGTFWLSLNYSCNNRCAGCYAGNSDFVDNPMSLDLALQIAKIMSDLHAHDCLLIGGEPTMYKHLEEFIQKNIYIWHNL